MDYNSYFWAIEQIKAFLQKNYTKIDTAYVIYDELFSSLDIDIILWNFDFKQEINTFIKDNTITAKINYFTLDTFKVQFETNLDKEFVFNHMINSWNIYGKGITNYYFKYLKKHFSNETIIYRGAEFKISDLTYDTRKSAGALVYNPNSKKFLLIKHNIQDEDYWALTKGGIEEGELSTEAAKREVFEESGIKDIQIFDEINFVSMHTYNTSRIDHNIRKAYGIYYPAITYQETIELSNEHLDYAWLSLDELKEKISFPISKYFANKLGSWLLEKYK